MINSDQKRAILAVLLSGLVLFGWQYFFAPKKVEVANTESAKQEVVANNSKPVTQTSVSENAPVIQTNNLIPNEQVTTESILTKNDFAFNLMNNLAIVDTKNPNSVFDFKALSDSKNPLKILITTEQGDKEINFNFLSTNASSIAGTNDEFGIKAQFNLMENGKLNFSLNSEKEYKYKIIIQSTPKKLDNGQVSRYAIYSNDVTFVDSGSAKNSDGIVKWVGLDFNYHLFAFVLKDKLPARYNTFEDGRFVLEIANGVKSFSGDVVFTKKNYDTLISLGDNLHLSVDFGYFSILAVPLLRSLQFIHIYLPNYGVAIILLTILIRLITFPLQYKSFKSMKKMQLIQPELLKIKEKFKDEPQRLQKETMDLFKKSGANPLSGCLPLLLQMPFFFAIYRVLGSSVELVGAPFMGWIHDLSIRDPFYVLPVLMGIAMLAQQKMTPQTSIDPTQQKIMMFMPVIFAFIMKSLPAGLVLYIFISTVVGVLQQSIVYKMAD